MALALPASAALLESENNGSLGSANALGLSGSGSVEIRGAITTNPADGLGDFDYFLLGSFESGGVIAFSMTSGFDPLAGLYDAAGVLVAEDDDSGVGYRQPAFSFNVTAAGPYALIIRGYGSGFADDPFSLTPGNPAGDQGAYTATVTYRGAIGVSEPASIALLGIAGLGLLAARQRRRSAS
jgi:hypothetical protein